MLGSGRSGPAPRSVQFFLHPFWPLYLKQGSPLISLQAISRRLSQEKKTLNLWPHSSVTAALPKPGETWVPSAEVGKSRDHHTQHLPTVFWVGGPGEGGKLQRNDPPAQAFRSTRWQHSPQTSWLVFFVLQKGYKTSLVSFLPGLLSQAHQGGSVLSLASSGRAIGRDP